MIPPKSLGGVSTPMRFLGFSVRWDIVEHLFGEVDAVSIHAGRKTCNPFASPGKILRPYLAAEVGSRSRRFGFRVKSKIKIPKPKSLNDQSLTIPFPPLRPLRKSKLKNQKSKMPKNSVMIVPLPCRPSCPMVSVPLPPASPAVPAFIHPVPLSTIAIVARQLSPFCSLENGSRWFVAVVTAPCRRPAT